MKILFVNKFLYENGGSETYIFRLRDYFESIGHEVQFFGMQDERNIAGNNWNILTKNLTFGKVSPEKLLYPLKIIYSLEARRKIKRVIELFKPDIIHLNNINFQITPSIIYEIKKHDIPIIFTAHDYQLICPNHMLYQPCKGILCEECIISGFFRCTKNNCIHGSKWKSILGSFESILYHSLKTYMLIDKIICPSEFLEKKLLSSAVFYGKTIVMHNFIQKRKNEGFGKKGNYVLYFGRFAEEKGIRTLVSVCRRLPEIPFVFAGSGPLSDLLNDVHNIKNVGFLKDDELKETISTALFSVYPSEWYENCPFSVMESQIYGTPVIGANIGGIPELIRNGETGLLFHSANKDDLLDKISTLWYDQQLLEEMTKNCLKTEFDTPVAYGEKLKTLYLQAINRE